VARPIVIFAAFALGLVAGTMIPPVMASRSIPSAAKPEHGQSATKPAIKGAYAAEVLHVIDGDTFEARVQVWPGLAVTTRVRLRGIDAPEMKARCAEERSKAAAARAALSDIFTEGDVTVLRVGLDKYGGRVIADVATLHTADVATALRVRGLARAYTGVRRDGWCGR
jgi:endonuclease YncB( thermonuclease family)